MKYEPLELEVNGEKIVDKSDKLAGQRVRVIVLQNEENRVLKTGPSQ